MHPLERLARSIANRPRMWGVGAIVALVLATPVALRLQVHSNPESLLSTRGARAAAELRAVLPDARLPRVVVVLESGRSVRPAEADRVFTRLERGLRAIPGVHQVRWRVRPEVQAWLEERLPRQFLLHLSLPDLEALSRRLGRDSIAAALARVDGPTDAAGRHLAFDPLGLLPLLPSALKGGGGSGLALVGGRYAFGARRAFLLLAELDRGDLADQRRVLGAIERLIADRGAVPLEPGLQLVAGGVPVAQAHVRESLLRDLRRVALLATALVAVLLAAFFRRLSAPLVLILPVAAGLLFAAAARAALAGPISLGAWILAGVVVGLGVDYGIHVASHYWRQPPGTDRGIALASALVQPGRAILFSALTTVAAFLSLGLLSWPVMADVAWITAVAMLAILGCTWTILPILLVRTRPGVRPVAGVRRATATWRGGRWPWVGLVLAGATAIPLLRFDADPLRLLRQGDPAAARFLDLDRGTGTALTPILLVSEGPTPAVAMERERNAIALLDRVADQAGIARIEALSRWIPPVADQRRNIRFIQAGGADLSADRVAADLEAAIAGMRSPYPYLRRSYFPRLRQALDLDGEVVTLGRLRAAGLGPELAEFVSQAPGSTRLVSRVYLTRPLNGPALTRFRAAAGRAGLGWIAGVSLPGLQESGVDLAALLGRDALRATLAALVLVLLVLLVEFRRLSLMALAFVPVVAGLAAAVVVMALGRIPLDPLTLSILPLLVGIGVDDGIHGAEGLRRGEDGVAIRRGAGPGMIITTLTTVAAFASLAIARFPGLPALALVGSVGLLVSLGAALHLLPLLGGPVRSNPAPAPFTSAPIDQEASCQP